ncbi:MAG: outer membrane protein assembly factor BamC [Gammaproteobacteria bacterium]|nr:outer membrane protein assembly factor BamC [Gammaproteobacteria bacterium]
MLGISDRTVEYKKTTSLPSLEIPPDLSVSTEDELVVPDASAVSGATYSAYSRERAGQKRTGASAANKVLSAQENMELKRDRDIRWLVIQREPEAVWRQVRDFWRDSGFKLTREDPRIGVMVTEWKENRGDIPKDFIRRTIGKAVDFMYSASTRDRFRVRLERGGSTDTTNLYLSHRGAEEVSQDDGFAWQYRPSDPELEAEMLSRLMIFLGVEEKRAKELTTEKSKPGEARAKLIDADDGKTSILVFEDFARVWRRTGIALHRSGFTIEDQDRSRGIYFVRYAPEESVDEEPGFFSKLFGGGKSSKSQAFQLNLIGKDETTRVTLKDKDAKPVKSGISKQVLSLLHEQLK